MNANPVFDVARGGDETALNAQQPQDIYAAFVQLVIGLNDGVTVDAGEWAAWTDICFNSPDIQTYAANARDGLWTDGEDQGSWTIVKESATAAVGKDDTLAMALILMGQVYITSPSHNDDQWAALRNNAETWIPQFVTPFQLLMCEVQILNTGITTDADEWGTYADICHDALVTGITTYTQRCQNELWTTGEDQDSWSSVIAAATAAGAYAGSDAGKLAYIFAGYLNITAPSHNSDEWAALRGMSVSSMSDGSDVVYSGGPDTRDRRTILNPMSLPYEMSMTYLIRKDAFPAYFKEVPVLGIKVCHVEYFMRLDVTDAEGSAYFIITNSDDYGGYVGLAMVPGSNVGTGSNDNKILVNDPDYAGDMVWWDHLDATHPGGCNHPGNGGQIGTTVVLVGQDWTKYIDGYGHVVEPVGNGSKVLFYDFASLANGQLPTQAQSGASDAYIGCLTTEQLNIPAGGDGEVSSVVIEQGPDGRYLLIAGNSGDGQTVAWTSATLTPDIQTWQQLPAPCASPLNDGSSMLAWAKRPEDQERVLCYVQSGDDGMAFRPVRYLVADGTIIGIDVGPAAYQTQQSDDFGDGDWVEDNGSIYAAAGSGLAMHGTYISIDDSKGPDDVPCVQVRTWYNN